MKDIITFENRRRSFVMAGKSREIMMKM